MFCSGEVTGDPGHFRNHSPGVSRVLATPLSLASCKEGQEHRSCRADVSEQCKSESSCPGRAPLVGFLKH